MNGLETCLHCDSHELYGFGLCYKCWERIYKAGDLLSPEELDAALNEEYADRWKALYFIEA